MNGRRTEDWHALLEEIRIFPLGIPAANRHSLRKSANNHLRDRKAVAEANRLNQGETQEGVENTKLIGELLGQANDKVTELDAIMYNKYTRQPEKLRAWQSASHVERAPQREKKPPTPPPA